MMKLVWQLFNWVLSVGALLLFMIPISGWFGDSWVISKPFTISPSFHLDFSIFIDNYSLLFFSTVLLIAISIFLYSAEYMKGNKEFFKFHLVLLTFVVSMFILVFSPGMFSLILGWDGLGVTSYLLVCFFSSPSSNKAAYITLMTNRLGDVLIMCAMGLMVGTTSWNLFNEIPMNLSWEPLIWSMWVMAAFTKSAQLPFSAWLPAAMAAPTPVSSLVHSSTLVTAGAYLLIRWSPVLPEAVTALFLPFGVSTSIAASFAALVEKDFKKMIALSTLSQLGLMILSLSLGSYWFCWFHLIVHAYFKATMFMITGVLIHNSQDYQSLAMALSPACGMPVLFSIFLTCNLSLMGLPFMSGFYSKDLILEQASGWGLSLLMSTAILMACLLTSLYSTRLMLTSQEATALSFKSSGSIPQEKLDKMVSSTLILWGLATVGASLLMKTLKVYLPMSNWHSAKVSLLMSLMAMIALSSITFFMNPSTLFLVSYLSRLSLYSSFSLATPFSVYSSNWALSISKFSQWSWQNSFSSLKMNKSSLNYQLMVVLGVLLVWVF